MKGKIISWAAVLLLLLWGALIALSKDERLNTAEVNSTSVETVNEYNWRVGKKFSYFHYVHNVDKDTVLTFAFITGDRSVKITSFKVFSSSSLVTWSWFPNATMDDGTGAEIQVLPLNSTVLSKSGTSLFLDPDNVNFGTALFASIDIVGVEVKPLKYKLEDFIISEGLAINQNSLNILRITNRHEIIENTNIGIKIIFTVM